MAVSEEDLSTATNVLLDELIRVQSGDALLLCTDSKTNRQLQQAITTAMRIRGGSCSAITIEANRSLEEAAALINAALQDHGYTILCEIGDRTFYQSSAWDEAMDLGTRIYSLAHVDASAFLRCVMGIDHAAMLHFGEKLHAILRRTQTIDIRSERGSHLRLKKREDRARRFANRFLRRLPPCTWSPTGVLRDDIKATFLGGQISFRPEQGSLEGTAVIDGFLWPPSGCGKLTSPLTWHFKRGQLAALEGSAPHTIGPRLIQHLNGLPAIVEHLSLGYHPGATLMGGIHEAERISGGLVVGVGQGMQHADGVMTSLSLDVDGIPLLDKGRFVHPLLP